MPVRFLLDLKTSTFFYRRKIGLVPAFAGRLETPTAQVMKQQRTNLLHVGQHTNTRLMDKCFLKRAMQMRNTLPRKIENRKYTFLTVKKNEDSLSKAHWTKLRTEKKWIGYRFK